MTKWNRIDYLCCVDTGFFCTTGAILYLTFPVSILATVQMRQTWKNSSGGAKAILTSYPTPMPTVTFIQELVYKTLFSNMDVKTMYTNAVLPPCNDAICESDNNSYPWSHLIKKHESRQSNSQKHAIKNLEFPLIEPAGCHHRLCLIKFMQCLICNCIKSVKRN